MRSASGLKIRRRTKFSLNSVPTRKRAAGFDFTGPLDPSEALTYRLVGLVRDSDFDFDFADKQRYYIAPSFTIRPDKDTSLTILGSAQRDSGFGPFQFVPLSLTEKSRAIRPDLAQHLSRRAGCRRLSPGPVDRGVRVRAPLQRCFSVPAEPALLGERSIYFCNACGWRAGRHGDDQS